MRLGVCARVCLWMGVTVGDKALHIYTWCLITRDKALHIYKRHISHIHVLWEPRYTYTALHMYTDKALHIYSDKALYLYTWCYHPWKGITHIYEAHFAYTYIVGAALHIHSSTRIHRQGVTHIHMVRYHTWQGGTHIWRQCSTHIHEPHFTHTYIAATALHIHSDKIIHIYSDNALHVYAPAIYIYTHI